MERIEPHPQEPIEHPKTRAAIDAIAAQCIAVRLRTLNRVITHLYDAALRPLGLKVSQLDLLVVAAKLGLARPAAVCRILQLDTSTLSRNVERMRAKGWLEVVPGEDARVQPFRLTAQGQRLLARAVPAWERAQGEAVRLLGEEGWRYSIGWTETCGGGRPWSDGALFVADSCICK